jgi:hypothetical protein
VDRSVQVGRLAVAIALGNLSLPLRSALTVLLAKAKWIDSKEFIFFAVLAVGIPSIASTGERRFSAASMRA